MRRILRRMRRTRGKVGPTQHRGHIGAISLQIEGPDGEALRTVCGFAMFCNLTILSKWQFVTVEFGRMLASQSAPHKAAQLLMVKGF